MEFPFSLGLTGAHKAQVFLNRQEKEAGPALEIDFVENLFIHKAACPVVISRGEL